MYRRVLKSQLDWAVDRSLFNEVALETREAFRKNMNVREPQQLEKLISNAERRLEMYAHPDPYKAPVNPGGSKWQRNIPPPPETCGDSAFREWL